MIFDPFENYSPAGKIYQVPKFLLDLGRFSTVQFGARPHAEFLARISTGAAWKAAEFWGLVVANLTNVTVCKIP